MMKRPAPEPDRPAETDPAPAKTSPEAVRRARFQNLIWRDQRARATHVIRRASAGPTAPQADVPAEWLREFDHRQEAVGHGRPSPGRTPDRTGGR